MGEHIKRSDAFATIAKYYHLRTDTQLHALGEALARVPTADVVEAVRCKNCRWRTEADTAWHPCVDMATNNNWFCGDGEAK